MSGIIAAGWNAVHWGKMGQIVASWFLSPLAGGVLGFILFKIISKLILGRKRPVVAAVSVTPFVVFLMMAVVTLAIVYKGLKHLAGLSNLQSLWLCKTAVTDAGLAEIKKLKSLQRLYAHSTKLTAEGVAELKKALPGCKVNR